MRNAKRTPRDRPRTLVLACVVLCAAPPALAQGDGPGDAPPEQPRQPGQPQVPPGGRNILFQPKDLPGEIVRFEIPPWSSAETERIGEMLTGSWRSSDPIAQRDRDAAPTEVWLHIAKTHIEGLDDVLYIEAHRSDGADRPYRQSFAQLYEAGDRMRLRTLEPTRLQSGLAPYAGFWAIPDQFPPLKRENVIATMDIALEDDGSAFEGRSLHRYPTDLLGAKEMDSRIAFDGATLSLADRGYDASGKRVWGPAEGQSIAFQRDAYPLKVEQTDNGLTILTYPTEVTRTPEEGELVRYAYKAWLWDTGRLFAASDDDLTLPEVSFPLERNTVNWAWEEALPGTGLGSIKRFISPPERAYRKRGWPLKGVPPDSRIIFLMECVNIREAPEPDSASDTEMGSAGG